MSHIPETGRTRLPPVAPAFICRTSRVSVLALAIAAGGVGTAGILPVHAQTSPAAAATRINLPAQPLEDSLRELAAQTQSNILFDRRLVGGLTAQPLNAALGVEQALDALLRGTGLGYRRTDEKTVMIVRADRVESGKDASSPQAPASGSSNASPPIGVAEVAQAADGAGVAAAAAQAEGNVQELERMVVTGTRLRVSNPVRGNLQVIRRDDIERNGYTSVPEVLRSVVQNYAGASGGLSEAGIAAFNADYGNTLRKEGVNLRGLGSGASLVLLDGRRLPAENGNVDLSTIPLAAIERIEILRDGSSALYGADAVAGVVNIILRKDYVGHETSATVGGTEGGGGAHLGWSHVAGLVGRRSSATVTLQHVSQQALLAGQRPYVGDLQHFMLKPESTMASGSFHGRIDIGAGSGWLRALRSEKDVDSSYLRDGMLNDYRGEVVDQSFAAGFDWEVGEALLLAAAASYGQTDNSSRLQADAPGFLYQASSDSEFKVRELEVTASGSLPWGRIGYAAGLGRRIESFRDIAFNATGMPTSDPMAKSRAIDFAYAEAQIPLLATGDDESTLVDLNLAARRDLFSTGQSATSPMATLRWNLQPGMSLSLRHAESFRPPTLEQQLASGNPMSSSTILNLARYIGPGDVPVGTIALSGMAPDLEPETSTSRSLSFTYTPSGSWIRQITLTGFVTDYRNKLGDVPFSLTVVRDYLDDGGIVTLLTPDEAAQIIAQRIEDSVLYNGDTGEIGVFNGNPADYPYLVDMRTRNMASIREKGADIDLGAGWDWQESSLRAQFAATYVRSYVTRFTPADDGADRVRTMFHPQRWKARGSVELDWRRYTASVAANYTDRYFDLRTGAPVPVASWLTFDLGLGADLGAESASGSGWRAVLNIDNLLDRRPPPIAQLVPFPIGYDASAANALGRSFRLSIRRSW